MFGGVFFKLSLNPLKRVKFISINLNIGKIEVAYGSLNPLKRVKFISIYVPSEYGNYLWAFPGLNPLKRVKFISILRSRDPLRPVDVESQSPQTGQVYFNAPDVDLSQYGWVKVSIPSNGSSLFQYLRESTLGLSS